MKDSALGAANSPRDAIDPQPRAAVTPHDAGVSARSVKVVRRRFGRSVAIAAAVLVAAAVWTWLNVGLWLCAPAAEPVKADAIVALGGDSGSRAITAGKLYRDGFAPVVVITGLELSPDAARSAYLDWRAKILQDEGVPLQAVLGDRRSRNSWQEAVNTRALMEQRGWKRVLVVSDPPHLRQAAVGLDAGLRRDGSAVRPDRRAAFVVGCPALVAKRGLRQVRRGGSVQAGVLRGHEVAAAIRRGHR